MDASSCPKNIRIILNMLHVFKTRLLRFACGDTEVREVAGGKGGGGREPEDGFHSKVE